MLDLNPLNGSLSPVYFLTMKMHCYDNQKRILKKLFLRNTVCSQMLFLSLSISVEK